MFHVKHLSLGFALAAMVGCTATDPITGKTTTSITNALGSTYGQLFCAFSLAGGGTMVAGLITDATGQGSPIAVLAANATGRVRQCRVHCGRKGCRRRRGRASGATG